MAAYEAHGESDEWYTPAYVFKALGVEFDLDVACPPEGPRHVPAKHFYSENSLEREWFGLIWMNPPFGHQKTKIAWLEKFFGHGNGIGLLPDRTSAPWWQQFMPLADAVLFTGHKIKFEMPECAMAEVHDLMAQTNPILTDAEISRLTRFSASNVRRIREGKEPQESPGTGTTLFAVGDVGKAALLRASSLGTVFNSGTRAA